MKGGVAGVGTLTRRGGSEEYDSLLLRQRYQLSEIAQATTATPTTA